MKKRAATDAVCAFPFAQLFLRPSGTVIPCCYLSEYPLGDIKTQSLEEIWNGEAARALRREFLAGAPETCRKQIDEMACNLIRRDLLEGLELKERQPFPMKRLDVALNGQCNLECVMCDIWKAENGVYNEHDFWEEGREKIFPRLKEIDVKGGEPFIQKDVYRLIDEISKVNPACVWTFTTNGHYRFNERIARALDRIELSVISVSIDSLDPENFARIRKKGELSVVLRALEAWRAYSESRGTRRFQVNVNVVIQKSNWRELPRFIEFCRNESLVLFILLLNDPPGMSLLNRPVAERCEIIDYYFEAMKTDRDRAYMRVARPLLASLPPQERLRLLEKHKSVLAEADGFGPSVAVFS